MLNSLCIHLIHQQLPNFTSQSLPSKFSNPRVLVNTSEPCGPSPLMSIHVVMCQTLFSGRKKKTPFRPSSSSNLKAPSILVRHKRTNEGGSSVVRMYSCHLCNVMGKNTNQFSGEKHPQKNHDSYHKSGLIPALNQISFTKFTVHQSLAPNGCLINMC